MRVRSVLLACICWLLTAGGAAAHELVSAGQPSDVDHRDAAEVARLSYVLLAGRGQSETRTTAQGQHLSAVARERMERLNSLAAREPGLISALALRSEDRSTLPEAVRPTVEVWTDLSGELQVVHYDRPDRTSSWQLFLLSGGRRVPILAASLAK